MVTGAPGSGKTALATKIACDSGFPFVKICSPSDLVGYTEAAKCQYLKKVSLKVSNIMRVNFNPYLTPQQAIIFCSSQLQS